MEIENGLTGTKSCTKVTPKSHKEPIQEESIQEEPILHTKRVFGCGGQTKSQFKTSMPPFTREFTNSEEGVTTTNISHSNIFMSLMCCPLHTLWANEKRESTRTLCLYYFFKLKYLKIFKNI